MRIPHRCAAHRSIFVLDKLAGSSAVPPPRPNAYGRAWIKLSNLAARGKSNFCRGGMDREADSIDSVPVEAWMPNERSRQYLCQSAWPEAAGPLQVWACRKWTYGDQSCPGHFRLFFAVQADRRGFRKKTFSLSPILDRPIYVGARAMYWRMSLQPMAHCDILT